MTPNQQVENIIVSIKKNNQTNLAKETAKYIKTCLITTMTSISLCLDSIVAYFKPDLYCCWNL